MSYVEVYVVHKNGNVVSYGLARNNHCFAPIVWEVLAKKHKFSNSPYIMSDLPGLQKLWDACFKKPLTEDESFMLAATFDFTWISAADGGLKKLCRVLREFYTRYGAALVPTMLEMATIIENAQRELGDDVRGIAFNACSANTPFWLVDEIDSRAFNVDTDAGGHPYGQYKGTKPRELKATFKVED